MRKITLTIALSFGLIYAASAQVFMIDDDAYNGRADAGEGVSVIVPIHGVEYDQTNYAPLGGGALLLAGLGAAYLIRKKNKQNR